MGVFLDQVEARRDAPEATAHRVSLYLCTDERRAVITESSDDAHFYASLSKRVPTGRALEFFPADGRSKVLDAIQILKDMGKLDRSFGIVDRDFNLSDDARLVEGHLLVLDVYSYENYFADHALLVELGKVSLGIDVGSALLNLWEGRIKRFLGTLPDSLAREHAIAFWCKVNTYNCNLNNFRPDRYLHINDDGSIQRDPDTLRRFLIETAAAVETATDIELSEYERDLSYLTWTQRFRGHYFWTMFTILYDKFRADVDDRMRSAKKSRARTKERFSERALIESATALIPLPQYVGDFLRLVGT